MKHPLYDRAEAWSGRVIAGAIEVHRVLGPGLLESIYERAFLREMEVAAIPTASQQPVPIVYKGASCGHDLRYDVLVDGCLLVENKACEAILPVHVATLLTYMRLLDVPIGLIFNYHEEVLKDGIRRVILPGADGTERHRRPPRP